MASRCRAQAASEVEETLKRLQSHKGVEAILIVNHDGVPLRSTMTVEQTKKYAEHMSSVSRSRCGASLLESGTPRRPTQAWWAGRPLPLCLVLRLWVSRSFAALPGRR